jgi:hypothetical protein
MPEFSRLSAASAARLLEKSSLALRGRVKELAAATPGIQTGDDTAVVTVEEVLSAPPTFPKVAGRDITIRLKEKAHRGEHAVFLVDVWELAATVGVIEVARVSGLRSANAVSRRFADAVQRSSENIFRDRISGADVVVAGVVEETRLAASGESTGMAGARDPRFAEAIVTVDETLKGRTKRPLTVLFPTSRNDVWINSPRLRPGLRAVFLLRRGQRERGGPSLSTRDLTALEPIDVLPIESVDDIRKWIGKKR